MATDLTNMINANLDSSRDLLANMNFKVENGRYNIYQFFQNAVGLYPGKHNTDIQLFAIESIVNMFGAARTVYNTLDTQLQITVRESELTPISDTKLKEQKREDLMNQKGLAVSYAAFTGAQYGLAFLRQHYELEDSEVKVANYNFRRNIGSVMEDFLRTAVTFMYNNKKNIVETKEASIIPMLSTYLNVLANSAAVMDKKFEALVKKENLDAILNIGSLTFDGFKYKENTKRANFNLTLDDFRGYPEITEELNKILEKIKNPGKGDQFGATVPDALLIWGPPGTGKTHLAMCIASVLDAPYNEFSAEKILSTYVDGRPQNIANILNLPGVTVIDEFDAYAKKRGGTETGRIDDQTVGIINDKLDGIKAKTDPTFRLPIFITNREDIVDPAILQRCYSIEVPNPTLEGIKDLLNYFVEKANKKYKTNTNSRKILYDIANDETSKALHERGFGGREIKKLFEYIGNDLFAQDQKKLFDGQVTQREFMDFVGTYKSSSEKVKESPDKLMDSIGYNLKQLIKTDTGLAMQFVETLYVQMGLGTTDKKSSTK